MEAEADLLDRTKDQPLMGYHQKLLAQSRMQSLTAFVKSWVCHQTLSDLPDSFALPLLQQVKPSRYEPENLLCPSRKRPQVGYILKFC